MSTPIQKRLDASAKKMELLKALLKKQGIETSSDKSVLLQAPLQKVTREEPLLLSFAQQRLWFLDQLEPDSVAYTIPLALRLRGTLDLPALQSGLRALIERHEVLRTTFASHDGQPVQRITSDSALDYTLLDLSHLPTEERASQERAWLAHQQAIPFDLLHGPLLRVRVLRHSSQEHLLLLLFHHIIDLATLYQAALTGQPAPLPPLPIQYADYAAWQRTWLQGELLEEQLGYWKQQLRGAPAFLDLPTDFPRPPQQTFRGHNLTFHWPLALRSELERLSQQEGATLFMTLLAAFAILLFRYTAQDDIVIGTPIANRSRPEIEELIGFFVNTLVLRTDLSGNPAFREVLRRVREVALGAYSYQDVPFEQVVDAVQPPRDASRSPLFQVMFSLETPAITTLSLPGLQIETIETEDEVAKFDLNLFMLVTPDGLRGELEYNCDLFTQESMQRLIEHWNILIRDLVAYPSHPISQLALLSTSEQHLLLQEWNAAQAAEKTPQRIHEVFEEQVERTPDAVALRWGEEQWSYRHLNERANQLAC